MRIAALTLNYPPRRHIGSEMATHAMLAAIARRGHDVQAFTTTKGDPFDHDGIPVTPGVREFRATAAKADVVITHAELARRVHGLDAPCVAVTHNARGGVAEQVGDPVWSLIVHNADTTARELAPYRQAPYVVVRPPVDWRDWQVDRTGDAVTLVNLTGEKGSDTFYELAKRMPDRRFLGVIGGWGDADIRDLPNVEIRPHGTDMRQVYADTAVLLMASEHESWGRVAVEAMSSGVPVVATDLPGPRECIGAGGVLVELDWWDEYERQLRRLENPDIYNAYSTAARERARELDPRPELARLVACVEALAAGRRGPWDTDGLQTWRNTRTGRTATVRADSPQAHRLAASGSWQEVTA